MLSLYYVPIFWSDFMEMLCLRRTPASRATVRYEGWRLVEVKEDLGLDSAYRDTKFSTYISSYIVWWIR